MQVLLLIVYSSCTHPYKDSCTVYVNKKSIKANTCARPFEVLEGEIGFRNFAYVSVFYQVLSCLETFVGYVMCLEGLRAASFAVTFVKLINMGATPTQRVYIPTL